MSSPRMHSVKPPQAKMRLWQGSAFQGQSPGNALLPSALRGANGQHQAGTLLRPAQKARPACSLAAGLDCSSFPLLPVQPSHRDAYRRLPQPRSRIAGKGIRQRNGQSQSPPLDISPHERSLSFPAAEATPISKGKVPARLNAAMNIRIAFEGVVPICSVASKNRSFSCGSTFATIGVIFSATLPPRAIFLVLLSML